MNHKFILYLFWALLCCSSQLRAQEKKRPAMLTKSSGDEQGLEIGSELVLKQDKDAVADALNGWWTQAMKRHDSRVAWFEQAKFGCFVHWGVYATAGGEWDGKGISGYAEHLMRARRIPMADYRAQLITPFNPVDFDADVWMKTARDAGMTYFIITAKHHDGFAMYPSAAYPFDIRMTRFRRDPMKELSVAAKKYGIKFGFYYSHAFDWEHPDAPGNDWDYQNPGGDKLLHGANWWESYPEFLPHAETYVDEKSIPQIKELINNYKPDILWFDTPHKLPLYLNLRVLKAVWDTNPDIVVNGRLARVASKNFGDYANTSDRAAFFRPTAGIWETVPTTNESYGYSKFDKRHKPVGHFVRLLASVAAKGGNVLMNIGPKGNGRIDSTDAAILKGIGTWMKANGESIYGTSRSPLPEQPWGTITRKQNTLYLHVFDWPKNGKLVIGGLSNAESTAFLLADPAKKKLKISRVGHKDMLVRVPEKAPDTVNTVIALTLKNPVDVDSVRLLSATQTNRLLVFDGTTHGENWQFGDGKSNREFAANWKSDAQSISWDVRLNEPATFDVILNYVHNADNDKGTVFLDVDGQDYPIVYGPAETPFRPFQKQTAVLGQIRLEPGSHTLQLRAGPYEGNQLLQPLSVWFSPRQP